MKRRYAALIIFIIMAAFIYSVIGCSFAVGTGYGPSDNEERPAKPTVHQFSNPVFALYGDYIDDLTTMLDSFTSEPCPDYVEASVGIPRHIWNLSLARLSVKKSLCG